MYEPEVLKNKPQLLFYNVPLPPRSAVNSRKAVSTACIYIKKKTGMVKPTLLPRQKLQNRTIVVVTKASLENCAYCLNKNTTEECT